MGDLESLLLVLAAIYLLECVVWVRRGAVLFINWWGLARTRWSVRHPGTSFANQRGAILFANPLPPLGLLTFGQQPPLSLSPDAALSCSAVCLNPTWRADQPCRLVHFAEIKTLERDGRTVLVNGELFLKAMSPFAARKILKLVREIKDVAVSKRENLIRQSIAASFDDKKVRARLEAFQKRAQPLRMGTNSLFLFLYVLTPLGVWRLGLHALLWPLIAGIFAHTIALALLFRRAHAELYPGGAEERFTPFLTMLLAPPTAIRAGDVLGKHLLEDFHALAIAKVLLTPADFETFARRVLLDLRFPMFPVCPAQEPTAVATEEWSRTELREAAEKFAMRVGLNVEKLLRPRPPTEAVHIAYCPRCDAQFVTRDAVCADCGGRPVVAWS